MTIKKFLAIWEVLRHFKSIFSTTLWMLLPGINVVVALGYAGVHTGDLNKHLYSAMQESFQNANDDALNGTREYWTTLLSESLLSLLYASIAVAVNLTAVNFLAVKYPAIIDSVPGSFTIVEWVTFLNYGLLIAVAAILLKVLFNMLHSIYKAYTQYHPEYAKDPLPQYYLDQRAKAISKRDAVVKVPVRQPATPEPEVEPYH